MSDGFEALAKDLDKAVGFRLFTALKVAPPYAERVYTNMPAAFPLSGRKRLDSSPWVAHVLEQGQPWFGQTAEDLRAMFPDHELIAEVGCGCCINIPVQDAGQTIGSLNLLDAENAYTQGHVDRAVAFAERSVPLFLSLSQKDRL